MLRGLNNSTHPINEVIIVDSGEDRLLQTEYSVFGNLNIQYLTSEKSVCIQRNTGIRIARSGWIFLCDDDIELPSTYLQTLVDHINSHSDIGAVSGQWLQKEKDKWVATYPLHSVRSLLWRYFFSIGYMGRN